VSNMGTLSMSGSLTNSGGDILLTKASAQSITASNGGDLTVSSNANTIIEGVTFNGAAMSGGSTISLSGNLVFSSQNVGISANSATTVTSFNTNSGNNNCESDSLSIGNKRFGIIQMQQKQSNGNGCYHSGGQSRVSTITHSHGSNYIVFLTTARNSQYSTNPLLWGVRSRSNNQFDLYFNNPQNGHTVANDGQRYQVAFFIVKTT
jgi:hypothetical protein